MGRDCDYREIGCNVYLFIFQSVFSIGFSWIIVSNITATYSYLSNPLLKKLQDEAEQVYKSIKGSAFDQNCKPNLNQCFCGQPTNSFKTISNDLGSINGGPAYDDMNLDERKKVHFLAELIYLSTIFLCLRILLALQ